MTKKELMSNYDVIKTIYAGEFFAVKVERNVAIHTLLGSCVAACIYDDINNIFGMNHFMLPDNHGADNINSKSAKYGVHAMELLINNMASMGASRSNFKAKIFGGAAPLDKMSEPLIGNSNINFISNFLKTESIPLVSSCVGGELGRVIYFVPDDFVVYVRKINKTKHKDIFQNERHRWVKTVDAYESTNERQSVLWNR
ncbi:MAG: chemotaxis protein CheD [Denitrovibrio sp.]|mgnify:CR=1 FL=1|nr:MAG: chemotaxis protein CheD [Denitrovibrio sp.]